MYLLMYTQLVAVYIAAFSRRNKYKHGRDLTDPDAHCYMPWWNEMYCFSYITGHAVILFFQPCSRKTMSTSDMSLWASRFHILCEGWERVFPEEWGDNAWTAWRHHRRTAGQEGKRHTSKGYGAQGYSLCRFWFSIQSQKNIGHIWGQTLWSRNSEVGGQREERVVSSFTSLD